MASSGDIHSVLIPMINQLMEALELAGQRNVLEVRPTTLGLTGHHSHLAGVCSPPAAANRRGRRPIFRQVLGRSTRTELL